MSLSRGAMILLTAIQLKMMMQRSKERYRVEPLDVKSCPTYSRMTYSVHSVAVEGRKSSDASELHSYVLFGALTRYAK